MRSLFRFQLINAVEKEIGMNWKPLMSKAEAEEYTRDSYYQGQDLYHGTNQSAADSITSEGARIESESVNTYGEGFYLALALPLVWGKWGKM